MGSCPKVGPYVCAGYDAVVPEPGPGVGDGCAKAGGLDELDEFDVVGGDLFPGAVAG